MSNLKDLYQLIICVLFEATMSRRHEWEKQSEWQPRQEPLVVPGTHTEKLQVDNQTLYCPSHIRRQHCKIL